MQFVVNGINKTSIFSLKSGKKILVYRNNRGDILCKCNWIRNYVFFAYFLDTFSIFPLSTIIKVSFMYAWLTLGCQSTFRIFYKYYICLLTLFKTYFRLDFWLFDFVSWLENTGVFFKPFMSDTITQLKEEKQFTKRMKWSENMKVDGGEFDA